MHSSIFSQRMFSKFVLTGLALGLASCGGGQLSLEEAEKVTLNFHGEHYVPPPRGISKLLDDIWIAPANNFCEYCEDLDVNDPDINARLENLTHMAMRSHRMGDTAQAKDYLKRASVEFLDGSFDDGEMVKFYNRMGILAKDIGNYSDAVKYLKTSLDVIHKMNRPFKGGETVAYALLSEVYTKAGNTEAAEDAASQSYSVYESIDPSRTPPQVKHFIPYWEIRMRIAQALTEDAKGNLRSAETQYYKLIDLLQDFIPGYKGIYLALEAEIRGYYLVRNLISQGRIAEAEAESRKAVDFSLIQFGRDNYTTANVLTGMIKVLMIRKEYEDAKRLIAVTEKIYHAISISESSLELANFRNLLVEVLISEGDWKGAEAQLNHIYLSLEKDKGAQQLFFNTNLNWAVILVNNGKYSQAERIAAAAYKYNVDLYGNNSIKSALARGIRAVAQTMQGNILAARKNYEAIIPVLVKGDSSSAFNYNIGITGQRLALIIEHYLDVLNHEFKSGNKKAGEEAFYLVQLIQAQGTQQAVSSSAARASIKNPRLVFLIRQEQDATQKIEAGYNKLASILAADDENRDISVTNTLKNQLTTLSKARESILGEIRDNFPEYNNLVRPKPVNLAAAQKILKQDEALLLTYSGNEKLYSWTLMPDGRFDFSVKNVSRESLKQSVMLLRKGLDFQASTLNDIPEFNTKLAYRLYQQVIKPGVYLWRGAKSLVIIPDAVLGALPFSVLVTENSTGQSHENLRFSDYRNISWLAKTHATSYVPSVVTLKTLRSRQLQAEAKKVFIGFGNPDFGNTVASINNARTLKTRGVQLTMRGLRRTKAGSLDNSNIASGHLEMLNPLPETAGEVLRVAGALKVSNKGNVFLGKEASEQRVEESNLKDRRIVMFATHALLPGDLDGLTQPAIALSSPKVTGSKNDGLLTMGEVMGLDLNADWVVLSACNTGAASGRGATAVSGLGKAFFYAGARSLLVSHWAVETSSARAITTGLFERQVKNKHLTRSLALNQTVLDLINNKTYKDSSGKSIFSYAHPMFWAPFTLVGDGSGILN